MKTILIPMNGTSPSDSLIDAAVLLARQINGFIQAVWSQQTLPIIAGEGITLPAEYLSQFEQEERELSEYAKSAFLKRIETLGIPLGEMETWDRVAPAAAWMELKGSGAVALAELARIFDVSVMHRPVPETTTDWRTTCETVLFEGGRPLLLVSDDLPRHFGQKIVLSWNGSSETARTIAMTGDLLTSADEVHVIEVEDGKVAGPTAAQVACALKASGANATSQSMTRSEGSVADRIMAYAREVDADLIIKGAYTHSRLRALIFGGVTSDIFSKSTLPVMFCH
ncbi:MAG: universal stress protein UspA [marine bacterium B5-7]|nr:MAG: universal stress protein UspA [marine bacterium B5-7]